MQLQAGHFMLPLLPERWSRPGFQRWRRLGQDNVIELQVSGTERVRRKLAAQGLIPCKQHEHLVTEWSEKAADVKFSGLQPFLHVSQLAPAVQVSMKQGKQPSSRLSLLHPLLPVVFVMQRPPLHRGKAVTAALAVTRWRRMVARKFEWAVWHAFGQLLWIVQRPYLRFLPYPYQSTNSPIVWAEQADSMVKSGAYAAESRSTEPSPW